MNYIQNKKIKETFICDFAPRSYKDFKRFLSLSLKLRRKNFDLGIDLRGSIFNSFFFLWFGKCKYRSGFNNQWFGKYLLDYSQEKFSAWKKVSKRHRTDWMMDLISKPLKINNPSYQFSIETDEEDEKRVLQAEISENRQDDKKSESYCRDSNSKEHNA